MDLFILHGRRMEPKDARGCQPVTARRSRTGPFAEVMHCCHRKKRLNAMIVLTPPPLTSRFA
ncbi:hypothetical protein HZA57_04710 [Candidatus Poribacteria bacterium]|nr:hypothetical protein [Candidatus Poribacteria bacterium]